MAEDKPTIREAIDQVSDSRVREALREHVKLIQQLRKEGASDFGELSRVQWGQVLMALELLPQHPHLKSAMAEARASLKDLNDSWKNYLDLQFPKEVRALVEATLEKHDDMLKKAIPPEYYQRFRRFIVAASEETTE